MVGLSPYIVSRIYSCFGCLLRSLSSNLDSPVKTKRRLDIVEPSIHLPLQGLELFAEVFLHSVDALGNGAQFRRKKVLQHLRISSIAPVPHHTPLYERREKARLDLAARKASAIKRCPFLLVLGDVARCPLLNVSLPCRCKDGYPARLRSTEVPWPLSRSNLLHSPRTDN